MRSLPGVSASHAHISHAVNVMIPVTSVVYICSVVNVMLFYSIHVYHTCKCPCMHRGYK